MEFFKDSWDLKNHYDFLHCTIIFMLNKPPPTYSCGENEETTPNFHFNSAFLDTVYSGNFSPVSVKM